MQPSSRIARAIALVLAPFAVAAPTLAADTILEEVVVSAQKREQNIQDVGIAIAAIAGGSPSASKDKRSS